MFELICCSKNEAVRAAVVIVQKNGGVLYSERGSEVMITSSTFINNTVVVPVAPDACQGLIVGMQWVHLSMPSACAAMEGNCFGVQQQCIAVDEW